MRNTLALLVLPVASASISAFGARALAAPSDPAAPAASKSSSVENPPGAVMVPGQLSKLFKIDDNNPEGHVPAPKDRIGNPLEFGYFIQDVLARAESFEKRNDIETAIKYYRAIAAAVPEEATGWSLVCEAYEKVHDRDRALRACRYALERQGVEMKDYDRTVGLIVGKADDLTDEERGELKSILDHLDKQPGAAVSAAHLRCRVAVKTKDLAAMKACTAVLAKAAPDDPKTIVFLWSFAVMRGDRGAAAALLERAQKAGVAAENIERMSQVKVSGWPLSRGLSVAVVGVAMLLALLLFVRFRRRVVAPDRAVP